MTRKRFINKMRRLYVEIYKRANGESKVYSLGEAFRYLRDADFTKALNIYGSYYNIWNSKLMRDLRKAYDL